jgi:hypothetical protein
MPSFGIADKITLDAVKTAVDLIKTYTDSLETNVGSDVDAASASGSVHAKLKQLLSDYTTARAGKIDNLDAAISTRFPDITGYTQAGYTASVGASTATVCNVNGRGIASITFSGVDQNDFDSCYAPGTGNASLTVDGVALTALNGYMSGSVWVAFNSSFLFQISGNSANTVKGSAIVMLAP